MKNTLRNKFLLSGLLLNANVTFAGAPHNFNYQNAGNNGGGGQQQNPMNAGRVPQQPGGRQPPNPQMQSKIIPGQKTGERGDPVNPQNHNENNGQGRSPLDKFNGIFDPTQREGYDPEKGKKKQFDILSSGRDNFKSVADKMDFSTVFTPENMAAIEGGGAGATKALQEMFNNFGRHLYTEMMTGSTGITKRALESRDGNMTQKMKEMMRTENANYQLTALHDGLNNPNVSPLLTGLQSQMAEMFPQYSPDELNTATVEYIKEAFGPFFSQEKAQGSDDSQEGNEVDFEKFFSQM